MSKIYRYPGSKPFTIEEKSLFFGRNDDIERLYKFINVEKLIVLYAKSGLGKSSLLNAGIIPKLTHEGGYEPILVRLGSYVPGSNESPARTFIRKITGFRQHHTFLNKMELSESDALWQYFKNIQISEHSDKEFVLILEQFEELFTYPEEHIEAFENMLAGLLNMKMPHRLRMLLRLQLTNEDSLISEEEFNKLYQPIEVKVVIAIRSDKLSMLNKFSDSIPAILHHCYELMPLTRTQAEDAILNPAHYNKHSGFLSPPFDYSDAALEKMLNFLTKNGEKEIEPFQLQILCQYVENLVISNGDTSISEEDLGNLESVYQNYYDHQIAKLEKVQEQQAARRLIEEGLIFEEEQRRISLYQGQIYKNYDITPELLQKLVDTHLLRAEPNPSGGFSYEISHDTLVSPILKSKNKRYNEQKKKLEYEEKSRKFKRRAGVVVITLASMLVLLSVAFSVWNYYKNQELKHINKELETTKKELEQKNNTLDSTLQQQSIINDQLKTFQKTEKGEFQQQIERLKREKSELQSELATAPQRIRTDSAIIASIRRQLSNLEQGKRRSDATLSAARQRVKELNDKLSKELYLIRNDAQYRKIRDGVLQEYKRLERELE